MRSALLYRVFNSRRSASKYFSTCKISPMRKPFSRARIQFRADEIQAILDDRKYCGVFLAKSATTGVDVMQR
jgi:hypothetical protein